MRGFQELPGLVNRSQQRGSLWARLNSDETPIFIPRDRVAMTKARSRPGSGERLPTPYAYVCLYTGLFSLASLCLAWLPFALVLQLLLPARARVRRWIGRRAITAVFRLFLRLLSALGACRFDLTELDQLRHQGPLILAPNHPGLFDAALVLSRLPDVVCIMKAELMGNLFLGAGARLAHYIPNRHPRAMLKAADAELREGSQLLLFPEGTRTERWPLNPLLPTVAVIARRARVPVQTLIVEADSAYLTKGWPLFRCPSMPLRYRVRLGRRFDPPSESAHFTQALEAHFLAELACARWTPPAREAAHPAPECR